MWSIEGCVDYVVNRRVGVDYVVNRMAGVNGEGDMIHTLPSWIHDTDVCKPPGGRDNDICAGPLGREQWSIAAQTYSTQNNDCVNIISLTPHIKCIK